MGRKKNIKARLPLDLQGGSSAFHSLPLKQQCLHSLHQSEPLSLNAKFMVSRSKSKSRG